MSLLKENWLQRRNEGAGMHVLMIFITSRATLTSRWHDRLDQGTTVSKAWQLRIDSTSKNFR
jgi:hypothetical protein